MAFPLAHGADVEISSEGDKLIGTVLSVQANFYWVRLDNLGRMTCDNDGQTVQHGRPSLLLCTRRSRLKKIGQPVWVGDRVQVEEPDWVGKRGAIAKVLDRSSVLDRPPVANADHILLMFALADPPLEPIQLSRFLIKAESTGLAVSLCLNKCDLVGDLDQQLWSERLRHWGYQPLLISLSQGLGLDCLTERLKHYSTIISGPSGVGKSSLINYLIPDVEQRVNAVSGKLGRGRHTTRHVELFELPSHGLVADTPGFNQPDLSFYPSQLSQYFPEVRHRLEQSACQFSNCLHRDEPQCAVRGDWERYEHYLSFLDDALTYEADQKQRSDKETAVKVKSDGAGRDRIEPKLKTKRYRRKSRRSETQDLQDLCGDVKDIRGYDVVD